MAKVAWIGLGVMGYPMAGHIRKKGGHDLTVYNRNAAKAEAWVKEYGGKTAPTPAEAAKDADFVFCCVGNDNDLREVTLGAKGAFATRQEGRGLHRQHHRVRQRRPRAVRGRQGQGLRLPRCAGLGRPGRRAERRADRDDRRRPGSLRQGQARDRQLRAHGDADRPGRAPASSPRWSTRSASPAPCRACPKASHFAQKAGLDIPKVMETISKGAAQSWQMDNRWKTMNEGKFDFGFAVDWMRKDLGICIDEAKRNGAKLPVAALVDSYYADVQKMGGNRWDTSSLIARLNKK